ncbi:MAG TPA: imidazolonepropionase [Planctomycetaceae bacterium]|nr:imidazolonepropionase [Planctomycetaceae bacterium]
MKRSRNRSLFHSVERPSPSLPNGSPSMNDSHDRPLDPSSDAKVIVRSRRRFLKLLAAGAAGAMLDLRVSAAAQEVPGSPQTRPIALIGGTIHPISGPPLENGTLVFADGKISAVGVGIPIPDDAERIDVAGKHLYPGLFESHSQIGLVEWSSVRATLDSTETGLINPNVEAHVAVNPESALLPVTRANGVLLALSAPSGGLVSGRGSVLQLDGWTTEDLAIRPVATMHVNWPRIAPPVRLPGAAAGGGGGRRGRFGGGEADGGGDPLAPLRQLFEQAKAYAAERDALGDARRVDLRLEGMRPLLDRSVPMVVAADGLAEIESAVAFAAEFGVRLVIFGGYDAPSAATMLREHDVPVIVSAVHRNPLRRHDAYDAAYTLPERLRAAGIRFCISGSGRSETWNARNLAYHAGTAVAYGLPQDEALRSITLSPAEILGVADRVGSLDIGKDATLIVTDGNPLETTTQVEHAWIGGRTVQLTSLHTRLYDKYREKYRQLRDAER